MALPLIGSGGAANVVLINRNQRRHIIIAVDALRVVCEERLRDNVCRANQRVNERGVLRERLLLGQEGGETMEVKLDITKGISIGGEELADSLNILTEASVGESERVTLLHVCVMMSYNEVIIHTLYSDPIILRHVLGVAEVN